MLGDESTRAAAIDGAAVFRVVSGIGSRRCEMRFDGFDHGGNLLVTVANCRARRPGGPGQLTLQVGPSVTHDFELDEIFRDKRIDTGAAGGFGLLGIK